MKNLENSLKKLEKQLPLCFNVKETINNLETNIMKTKLENQINKVVENLQENSPYVLRCLDLEETNEGKHFIIKTFWNKKRITTVEMLCLLEHYNIETPEDE